MLKKQIAWKNIIYNLQEYLLNILFRMRFHKKATQSG